MALRDRFLALPWVARFVIASAAGVLVLVVLCWIVFGFGSLGLDPTATFAAALGITFTVGLGIGLMALVFYSDRSGTDDVARGEIVERPDVFERQGQGTPRDLQSTAGPSAPSVRDAHFDRFAN